VAGATAAATTASAACAGNRKQQRVCERLSVGLERLYIIEWIKILARISNTGSHIANGLLDRNTHKI
jgi:hypothetical protein